MLDTTKRTLATLTAATFLGAGGWAIASSQNSSTTTTTPGAPTQQGYGEHGMRDGMHRRGPMGAPVADADLAKITAAVTAKLPGAKVERAMKAPDGTFHAHVVTADGTEVHVALSSAFAVTAVDQRIGPGGKQMGPGGMRGHRGGMPGAQVSADVLAKVTAAVTAKLPGAKVERAMKAPDGAYHAHVVKKDGTHVHVVLNASFAVTAVETGGRKGGPGGPGGPRHNETALTGDAAAKATAAALAKVPGAKVDQVETDADGSAYEAHLTKADGSRVTVKMDRSFTVTAVEQH